MQKQEKLLAVMAEKDVNIYRLAKSMGVHYGDLHQAINGKKQMFPKYKRLISQYFEMSERELFEEE